MANEQRVREDYRTGTITDNPLLFDAITMNSAELAAVREVTVDQHMTITLDPTGAFNGPETAHIVAHEAGATVATLRRGVEATDNVEHPQACGWAIGPGKSDFMQVVTAADDLPVEDAVPYPGQSLYDFGGGLEPVVGTPMEGPYFWNGGEGWERAWNVAWGLWGQTNPNIEHNLLANGINDTPSDWNLAVSVDLRAGREYEVVASGGLAGTALDTFLVVLADGGNVTLADLDHLLVLGIPLSATGRAFLDGHYSFRQAADASKTFKLRGLRTGGGSLAQFGGNFDRPAYIRVFDRGPWAEPT